MTDGGTTQQLIYGMTPEQYAAEVQRKQAAGIKLTQPLHSSYVAPAAAATPPVVPPVVEPVVEPVVPPGTSQDVLALLRQLMGGSQFPYEQMSRDVAATAPQWTPRPESELLTQAQQYAGLQIDPQLQALQRSLGQARQEAGTYTQEAEKRALESAIARGGGRSGVVEWLTAEQTKPITTALARAETAGLEQMQQLEARRGELAANQLAALRQLEHANASGNWQLAQQATAQLAQLAQQAQQFQQTYALNVLPYFQEQAGAAEDRWLREAETFGRAGGAPAATPSGAVPLRSYATGQGASIDYDASTGQVIINGQRYTTQQLQTAGGYKQGDHWYLPQSWVDQQIGGRVT
jgi:hypothetical protein